MHCAWEEVGHGLSGRAGIGLSSSKASIGMRLELGGWVMGRGGAVGQGFNFHWGGAWPQGLSSAGVWGFAEVDWMGWGLVRTPAKHAHRLGVRGGT